MDQAKSSKIKIILGAGLVFVIALWIFAHTSLDSIIASAIRKYGSEVMGVSVKVSSVKLTASTGNLTIKGLSVDNPSGFKTDDAFVADEISVTIDAGTLTSDVIRIKQVVIKGPRIAYESNSRGNNLITIQRNSDRYVSEHFGKSGSAPSKPGKKLIIDEFQILNAGAEVNTPITMSETLKTSIPDIRLHSIGKGSNGASPAVVVKYIMTALNDVVGHVAGSIAANAVQGAKNKLEDAGNKIKNLFGHE